MKTVVASAPGRVCFAGEDIDWISGPSILCAINLRTNVKVSALASSHNQLELKTKGSMNGALSLPLNEVGRYTGHVLDYVNASMKVLMDMGIEPIPLNVEVTSNLPARAGLSSSAAVSVATMKALSAYFGLQLNEQQIAHLAYLVEKDELKTGAGQMDQYSCALGGLIYLNSSTTPPSNIRKFSPPTNAELIVVDTLTPRSTAEVIRMKRERFAQGESGILQYVEKTENLILNICDELDKPSLDAVQLGRLVTACQDTLRDDMRVSTPLLEASMTACLENGAFGAKITGTGMGGCMFALVPSDKSKQVQTALSNLPVRFYVTAPSPDGVVIL